MNDVLPALLALAAAAAPPTWRYEVTWRPEGLEVVARLATGSGRGLTVGAPGFVRQVSVDGAPTALADADCRRGCVVRLRFDLAASTDEARGFVGPARGGIQVTRPGDWLPVPARAPRDGTFALTVHTPAKVTFAAGLEQTPEGWRGPASLLADGPPAAFGPLDLAPLPVPGARRVTLALPRIPLAVPRSVVEAWVTREATRVARYFGGLPVPDLLVLALPVDRDDIPFGSAHGLGGATLQVYVGKDAPAEAFRDDWKLRHELVHLGLPNLPPRHRWMEEGLATYLEALLGADDEAALWGELAEGVAQGLPRGEGLDGTRRWGETYWGGALYWLMADVELRVASHGAKSLQDALQTLRAAGGNMTVRWPLARTLAAADAGTGQHVLTELHRAFGERGAPVDLEGLLKRLGVATSRGPTKLSAEAPWAPYRPRPPALSADGGGATRLPARSR